MEKKTSRSRKNIFLINEPSLAKWQWTVAIWVDLFCVCVPTVRMMFALIIISSPHFSPLLFTFDVFCDDIARGSGSFSTCALIVKIERYIMASQLLNWQFWLKRKSKSSAAKRLHATMNAIIVKLVILFKKVKSTKWEYVSSLASFFPWSQPKSSKKVSFSPPPRAQVSGRLHHRVQAKKLLFALV